MSELTALDESARMLLFLRAQRDLTSPLPTDLLEVLSDVDDLDHFVAVRRSQEVGEA